MHLQTAFFSVLVFIAQLSSANPNAAVGGTANEVARTLVSARDNDLGFVKRDELCETCTDAQVAAWNACPASSYSCLCSVLGGMSGSCFTCVLAASPWRSTSEYDSACNIGASSHSGGALHKHALNFGGVLFGGLGTVAALL